MPIVNKTLIVPFTTAQMYDLVNDLESYPQFLPWCRATEVHSRTHDALKATIYIAKGPVEHSITTVNTMQAQQLINMEYVAGPFRSCKGAWTFDNLADTQSRISFSMEYIFKNRLTAIALEPFFQPMTNNMIEAFYKRAEQIYGH